jgi:putative spermidine/putrescine transport system permease protein
MQCFLLLLPVLLFLSFIYVFPILRMLSLSFLDPTLTLKHYEEIFNSSIYYKVFLLTFKISIIVTIVCLLLGYFISYLLVHISPKYASILLLCVIIPLWTSVLVRTYAWMVLLGRNGVLNQLMSTIGIIDTPIKMMHNTFGVYIGMIQILLPFIVLPLYSVMRGIDKNLITAANSLGAGPVRAFLSVFLPLSLPGIISGTTLVFIIALGFFITPALLGGVRDVMVSMLIERQVDDFLNWGLASAISVILLLLTGSVFIFFKLLAKLLKIQTEESNIV